jgi:hypothetical protein
MDEEDEKSKHGGILGVGYVDQACIRKVKKKAIKKYKSGMGMDRGMIGE